jgi:hypothetical protein
MKVNFKSSVSWKKNEWCTLWTIWQEDNARRECGAVCVYVWVGGWGWGGSHLVNNACAADDGSDEGRVTGAVDERELDCIVRLSREMLWKRLFE